MAGGSVLSVVYDRIGRRHLWALCAGVLAAHAVLFFYPPGKVARAASYRAFKAVDRMNTNALTAVQALRRDGPLTIVHYGSSVASRHLAYYFPEDYVVVLPGSPANPAPAAASQVFYQHEALSVPAGVAGLIRPGSRKIVCLLPWNAKPSDLPGAKQHGAVYYLDRAPGTSVAIGPYRLVRLAQ